MLKLIACVDENYGISKQNKIPWKNDNELIHFKNITENNIVVMGTNTYYSIGKVLSNRTNIVLSKNKNLKIDNATVINDYKEILKLSENNDVFIIGGSQIYKLFEHYYDELIISKINSNYNCDKYLNINLKLYKLISTNNFNNYSISYYKSYKDKLIYGTICSNHWKDELLNIKNQLINKYKKIPTLSIIQIGNNYSSNIYINNKIKLANELGINCIVSKFSNKLTESELIKIIQKNNKNKKIHGILLQSPLPKHISNNVFNIIHQNKDVDCFNLSNIGSLWTNNNLNDNLIPCTALGIIELLKFNNIELESKNVAIVGRSNIVSKPLISLLLANNATVTTCHSKTKNLKDITSKSDITIVSIGKSNFFDSSYFNKNSIVIDVGINRDSNNKITGDINLLDVIEKINKITPVPYGVGPMTIISLFRNLLICYKKQFVNKK